MKRSEKIEAMLALVASVEEAATPVARSSPDHGPRHWRDVARVAHALWAEGIDVNADALFAFALMHDSQRLNEFDDPDHGRRAAEVLTRIGVPFIDTGDAQSIELAMSIHNSGATATSPTVAACLDADRLTLYRVGIVPNTKLLSTEVAKEPDFLKLGLAIVESDDCTWEEIAEAYAKEAPLDTRVSVINGAERDHNASYAHIRRMMRGGTLCTELQSALVDMGEEAVLGTHWIMHPLIHEPFMPGTESHLNDRLKMKRELIRDALDEGKWHTAVFHHERPYRVAIFESLLAWRIKDPAQWWEIVSGIWTDSENIWQEMERWEGIFESAPEGDPMDDEERKVFDALPDEITIYRGTCAPDGIGSGMSWTLDRDKAEWFATRLYMPGRSGAPQVVTGVVSKADAIGYQAGRGEQEIIALAEHVTITDISTVSVKKEGTAA